RRPRGARARRGGTAASPAAGGRDGAPPARAPGAADARSAPLSQAARSGDREAPAAVAGDGLVPVRRPRSPARAAEGSFHAGRSRPGKVELLLARIAELVGPDNAGAPDLLDTHRPDAFVIERFHGRFSGPEPVRKKTEFPPGF